MTRLFAISGSVAALAAATLLSGVTASATSGAANAQAAAKPPGYTIVHSADLPLPAGMQTMGTVTCPVKKGVQLVPLGGGVLVSVGYTDVNLNSSFASADGWDVFVNNADSNPDDFYVFAICADKPSGYQIVSGTTVPVAAGGGADSFLSCPSGKQVISGGLVNPSGSIDVNMDSSAPAGSTRWYVLLHNESASPTTFLEYAVCAKYPTKTKYTIVIGNPVDNPAGTQTVASLQCPKGLSLLDGGVTANDATIQVSLSMEWPATSQTWYVAQNNVSAADAGLTEQVICAA